MATAARAGSGLIGASRAEHPPPARPAAPSTGRGIGMGKRAKGSRHGGGATDIRTLEMMLDYAIIEGAELRLPLFVLLLRAARLELMTGLEANGGLRDRRVTSKIKDCFGDGFGLGGCESITEPVLQPRWSDTAGEIRRDSSIISQDR
jgi:hypothetical protein